MEDIQQAHVDFLGRVRARRTGRTGGEGSSGSRNVCWCSGLTYRLAAVCLIGAAIGVNNLAKIIMAAGVSCVT